MNLKEIGSFSETRQYINYNIVVYATSDGDFYYEYSENRGKWHPSKVRLHDEGVLVTHHEVGRAADRELLLKSKNEHLAHFISNIKNIINTHIVETYLLNTGEDSND